MILLTGATGMQGAYLLYDLLRTGKPVRAIKRSSSTTTIQQRVFNCLNQQHGLHLSPDDAQWVEAGLLDYQSLFAAMQGVRVVYHAAAMVSFVPEEHRQMLKTNIEGTANVVNAALNQQVEKLAYVSSIAALGSEPQSGLITENSKRNPKNKYNYYAVSKFNAEMEVWRGTAEGLPAVIVNPSIILGVGDWQKGSPAFFGQVWKGFPFYTKGRTGFVDARDVSKVLISLVDSPVRNERFILSAENLTYQAVFTEIARVLKKKPPQYYASRWLTGIAWRFEALKSKISRQNPLITRETADSAHEISRFSNEKITKQLDFQFTPIEKTIEDIGRCFLSDK